MSRGFDPWTREGGAGNTWVLVDQFSGEIVYDGSPEDGNVFDQAWDDWSFPVHTGDFLGTPTRVLWVVLGLSPLVLGVTGITMNLVRRSKRAKRAARIDAVPADGMPDAVIAVEDPTARRYGRRSEREPAPRAVRHAAPGLRCRPQRGRQGAAEGEGT